MIRRTRGFGIPVIPTIPDVTDTVLRPLEVNGGLTSEMLRKGLANGQLLSGERQQKERKSASSTQDTQTPTRDQKKR